MATCSTFNGPMIGGFGLGCRLIPHAYHNNVRAVNTKGPKRFCLPHSVR